MKILYLSFLSTLDDKFIWRKNAPSDVIIKNELELNKVIDNYKKEITIKDLSKWPNGVWSAAPSDTGIITKRPQVLAFRKWQKDLYETNLKKA